MIHPHTELRFVAPSVGYGVFATQDIPRGTIVWARDALDQTVPASLWSGPAREMLARFTFREADGDTVLCWDIARYVNHSCRPAMLSPAERFSIAVADIRRGTELTEDYGSYRLLPEEAFECACGMPECRKRVVPRETSVAPARFAGAIRRALAEAARVEQPLLRLLTVSELEAAASRWGRIAAL